MQKKIKIILFSILIFSLLAGGIISYSLIFSEEKIDVTGGNNSSDSSSSQPSQPQPKPKPKPRPKPKTEEEEIKMFFEDLAGKYGYEVQETWRGAIIPKSILKILPEEVEGFGYPCPIALKIEIPESKREKDYPLLVKEIEAFFKKKGFVSEINLDVESYNEKAYFFPKGKREIEKAEFTPSSLNEKSVEYVFYYCNFQKTHLTKEIIQDIANYYIKKYNVSASDPNAESISIDFAIQNLYFDKKTNTLWIELYITLTAKLNGDFETGNAYGIGKVINGKYYELFDSAPYCGDLEKYRVPKEFSSNLTFECRTIRD